MTHKVDIYSKVTDRIIADLEEGVATWRKPWKDGAYTKAMPLRHNGIPYTGVNVLILWSETVDKGYTSPHWFTYRQAQAIKGQVRKGQHGTTIVYASTFTKDEQKDNGETVEKTIRFLKTYSVFNANQIDGLPAQYDVTEKANETPGNNRIACAEVFVLGTGATIYNQGSRAYYSPTADTITLPQFDDFVDGEAYYATALHELTHWSGAELRLDRQLTGRQNEPEYAREELVAELASTFLCAELGIESEPREDHAQYLAYWLAILKSDKRAIFQASTHAQRAADFLKGLQPKKATADAPSGAEVAA